MPLVDFHVSHFHGGVRTGRFDQDVAWHELVHAAITVGKWRDDLFAHGRYSAFEATYRANLLWAYLRGSSGGHYVRTGAYDDLDATEKSGVSYTLGMTMAKVFAARELSVPWLMHLDRYRDEFGVRLRPGRSRPDLVGPRNLDAQLDWLVAEAKGRTHDLDSDADAKMVAQKQRVLTIGGQRPLLYIGAAAHFTSGALECRVVDPQARGRRHELFVSLDDARRRFIRAYYQPLIDLLEQGSTSDDGYILRALPEADLRVGMSAARLETIRRGIAGEGDEDFPAFDAGDEKRQIQGGFVGADGVRIELGVSWSEDAMAREPRERPGVDQRA